jgi:putative transposase
VTFHMQSAQLPACKGADPSLREVYAQVLQDVLRRVDKTYPAFFKRRAGYPRFKHKVGLIFSPTRSHQSLGFP